MNTADRIIRWAAALSVLTVTAIAAVISYRHAYELVAHYGETGTTARVLPLTIDGLIATCSLVLLDCARRNQHPPRHAWALLTCGVAATLGANIAHGADHGPIGALVAGWPALVAVGTFELLTRILKSSTPAATAAVSPEPGATEDPTAFGTAPEHAEDPAVQRARQHFADLLTDGQLPSLRAIKRELHIGHTRATKVLAVLSQHRGE